VNKTNETKVAIHEDQSALAETELAVVTGGTIAFDWEALRQYIGAVSVSAALAHEAVHAR
jgi:hypothetical protein